jgi:hypothetical protein
MIYVSDIDIVLVPILQLLLISFSMTNTLQLFLLVHFSKICDTKIPKAAMTIKRP